ncbi:NAD(P)H-dependent oxidoreductase [Macrococcus hajekii]|uniref:NAD(P)H-dependent oxidoreductase n=1 Tax=Macrococcus hajekii TaxID=198482 RepID=A0A4R6BJB5_9STAP|nr:NAD(P)H-dependent oxidoreductase [Macrococcus hajekii]TDM01737.1 NAD(P)H-dependent oxidoreductase [Macrococcus hajekii]GGB06971.1 NAD(P)H-dependent oxidoreductase [Macrococcus hajekii]
MNNEQVKQQVLSAFEFRRAIKSYDPDKKIEQSDLEYILEAGRLSPSSVGLEPWRFIVLENEEVKNALHDISWGAKKQFETASHFVLLVARKNAKYDSPIFRELAERWGLPSEQVEKTLDLYKDFQVEHMDIADSEKALFDWTSKQTYIALGNMMTAAALIGVDSCPIEGFHYGKVNEILTEAGVIHDDEGISVMMSLGYRDHDPKRPQLRKDKDEVISYFK